MATLEIPRPHEHAHFAQSPLARLTTVKPDWFVQVTPALFPLLFRDNPAFQKQYEDLLRSPQHQTQRIFTLIHRSVPLSFDALLALSPQQVNLADLLYRQHIIEYPSQTVKLATVEMNRYWQLNSQKYIRTHFSEEELAADLSKGHPSKQDPDSAVNTFLALQLTTNREFAIIGSPRELAEVGAQVGLRVDFDALRYGFTVLTGRSTIDLLIERGMLAQDRLEDFYQQVSEWQVRVTECILHTRLRLSKSVQDIWLYPDNPQKQDDPKVDYLPYIASSLLSLVCDLPYTIPAGRSIDQRLVVSAVRRCHIFATEILARYVARNLQVVSTLPLQKLFKLVSNQNPQVAAEVKDIVEKFNGYYGELTSWLTIYREEPRLLNRALRQFTPGDFPKYLALRAKILLAGDRAPKKPLYFDPVARTKGGEV